MKLLIFLIFIFYQEKEFVNSDDLSINNIKLNSNISDALHRFGKADSIVIMMNEFTDEAFETYYFKNTLLYVENKSIIGFRIKDLKLIKIKNQAVTNSFLANHFPNSFHKLKDMKRNSFKIQIDESDSYLEFIFDSLELTEIRTFSDF